MGEWVHLQWVCDKGVCVQGVCRLGVCDTGFHRVPSHHSHLCYVVVLYMHVGV